ncbi:mobilization protein [Campylobacter coli]|uniref:mobilization protein n=1 Tax=Campylobacter coli TaxID=195 RepID=UPI003829416B
MEKLEDKLAKLKEQRARIKAEIQRVREREQQQERRDDTRRKIIVGAMLTGMIEAGKLGQFNEVWLRAELVKQLDRDPDRAHETKAYFVCRLLIEKKKHHVK